MIDFKNKKVWIWGGAGLAVLIAVWYFMGRNSSGTGDQTAYLPTTVYGAGSVAGADPGGLGGTSSGSTDNSIAQLIAGNLQMAQEQANAVITQSNNQKDVALATLDANTQVALSDNQTTQNVSLASQLGNIVSAFTTQKSSTTGGTTGFFGIGATGSSSSTVKEGPGSIVGSLGFQNGMLDINLAQGPKAA